MLVREQIEAFEREHLSPAATLACNSLGRERPEEEDDLRTCFMRDRDWGLAAAPTATDSSRTRRALR